MKIINLLSSIALACLVAGFVSCSQTGIESPETEQNRDCVYFISTETFNLYPAILDDLVRQGKTAVVCDPDQVNLTLRRGGPAQLYFFIGEDFSRACFESPEAQVAYGLNYIGSTNAYISPGLFVARAGAETTVRATSESVISADPACYQALMELPAYQRAQFESEIAKMVYDNPAPVRIKQYHSMNEFFGSDDKFVQLSGRYALAPYSKSTVPVQICAASHSKADEGRAVALKMANFNTASLYFVILPLYVEEGFAFVSKEVESSERKSPDIMLRQVGFKDMRLDAGEFFLDAIVERRGVVYVNSSWNLAAENPEYALEWIAPRLAEQFKVISGLDDLPVTMTAPGAYVTIGYTIGRSIEIPATEFIVSPLEATFAVANQDSDSPKIRLSLQAGRSLIALSGRRLLDQKISNAFDSYIGERLSAKQLIYMCSASEMDRPQMRSGESADGFLFDSLLPVCMIRNVHVFSEPAFYRAESSSEDYFYRTMQVCGLMLAPVSFVSGYFLYPDRIDAFSPFEYSFDGNTYCKSFMETIGLAVGSGDIFEISARLKIAEPRLFE